MSCIVTTSHKSDFELKGLARELASKLELPVVERGNYSLPELFICFDVKGIIVVSKLKIAYHYPGGQFFFHPDKSGLRIKGLQAGKTDQMIQAMDLIPGDSILDCTLGLSSDAIVSSYVVTENGRVVGIESSRVIATLVEAGLKGYKSEGKDMAAAMSRIEVIWGDHCLYLSRLAHNTFDVVYFDPMFRHPIKSPDVPYTLAEPLRPLANHRALELETIRVALRVARRRVVIKENRYSKEFARLGAHMVVGGKNSPVRYGVWLKEGGSEGVIT